MAPKLSVVVPYYGVEDYIEECLASIAAQTLRDFECILVDDGSLDGSRAIAERFAAADPRFRIVTQPNAGLGAARNTGTAHSSGEYLMFVDSDDLLAPRAFEQLVTSLDRTGSDFAGGNVWRASLKWGLVVSEAHRAQFAEHRERVTINDVPLLMRDRMIWNKVYRRSFWDAGGYEFPEIRFEDYPVTLKAHLEASAVDLLPDPLYVWREREAGTSISQQGFDIGNVRDRVRALHLVLDFVEKLATDEVKTLVSSYFVQVDLREIMDSMLTVAPEHRLEVERLIVTVVERIDPERIGEAPAFNQLFYRAARAGDWPLCRALATWHTGAGWRGFASVLSTRQLTTPLRLRAAAQLGPVKGKIGKLRSKLPKKSTMTAESAAVSDTRLLLTVHLPEKIKGRAHATVSVNGVELPSTEQHVVKGLFVEVPLAPGQLPAEASPITVAVQAGPWHRSTEVQLKGGTPGVAALHGGRVVYGYDGSTLLVCEPEHPVGLRAVTVEGSEAELSLIGLEAGELGLRKPFPEEPAWFPVVDGRARLHLDTLFESDVPDNPWTFERRRPLIARDAHGERPVFGPAGGVRLPATQSQWRYAVQPDAALHLIVQPAKEA